MCAVLILIFRAVLWNKFCCYLLCVLAEIRLSYLPRDRQLLRDRGSNPGGWFCWAACTWCVPPQESIIQQNQLECSSSVGALWQGGASEPSEPSLCVTEVIELKCFSARLVGPTLSCSGVDSLTQCRITTREHSLLTQLHGKLTSDSGKARCGQGREGCRDALAHAGAGPPAAAAGVPEMTSCFVWVDTKLCCLSNCCQVTLWHLHSQEMLQNRAPAFGVFFVIIRSENYF